MKIIKVELINSVLHINGKKYNGNIIEMMNRLRIISERNFKLS